MKIGELFVALGFDVDDAKLKDFSDGVKSARNELLKMTGIASGALYAIHKFVDGSVKSATAMRNFRVETGNSIEGLQKWQVAAQLTDSAATADDVTSSFYALSAAIADVTLKGGGGEFRMLGISDVRGRDVSDVLEELRENYQKNIKEWTINGKIHQVNKMMESMGFSPRMLNALKLPKEEFEKIVNGRILEQSSIDKLVKLGDAFADIRLQIKLFKDQLSAEYSPKIIEMMQKSLPIIKDFSSSIRAVFLQLKESFDNLDPAVQAGIISFLSLIAVYMFPATAAVTALALAFWDLGRAIRGLPSFSGAFVNQQREINKHIMNGFGFGEKRQITTPGMGNANPQQFYGNFSAPRAASNEERRMMQNNQVSMSNVWHIQSGSDAMTLSDLILQKNQQMLENALSEQNKGVRY